jgi:serine/threonine protein phosphatase 1
LLTYAIGDIHGCAETLIELLRLIHIDADGKEYKRVFLGDYIDRGPNSKKVVDTLMSLDGTNVFLLGNHEDMYLASDPSYQNGYTFYERNSMASSFMYNGGSQTLESYNNDVPQNHQTWYKNLQLFHEDELRFYVHAGIVPQVALDEQHRGDLLWIRHTFLYSESDHGKYIVHGHTPNRGGVDIKPNRVNLDSGCVFGYNLSAGVFDDSQAAPLRIIQVAKRD